jgi:hypothetical protein
MFANHFKEQTGYHSNMDTVDITKPLSPLKVFSLCDEVFTCFSFMWFIVFIFSTFYWCFHDIDRLLLTNTVIKKFNLISVLLSFASMGEDKKCTRFWWESRKERYQSEDEGVDGRMGSEWILGMMDGGGN